MKAKEILDVAEQLEFMAEKLRHEIKELHPDAEVPKTEQNHKILFLAEWVTACRPEAQK